MRKSIIFAVIYLFLATLFGGSVIRDNNKAVVSAQDTLLYNAEKVIDKALKKDEDNPILNHNRGVIKLRQFEEYKDKSGIMEAIANLEKAKADTSRTNLHSVYYNQGNGFYYQQDFGQAMQNYQESSTFLDSTSVDPDLLYNYANSLYKIAETNAEYDSLFTYAQEVYQGTAGMVDSNHKQQIMHNLGNSFFKQKMYQESLSPYIEALRLNPKSEDTRMNYEIALRELEAQQSQEQQQQDNPNDQGEEQETSETSEQEQQKQQDEAKEKQDQYKDLSEEEKEKLEAEKKLDALLQQQSQPENEDKPDMKKPRPTGRYW